MRVTVVGSVCLPVCLPYISLIKCLFVPQTIGLILNSVCLSVCVSVCYDYIGYIVRFYAQNQEYIIYIRVYFRLFLIVN